MRKKPSWLLETVQNEHKNYENVIYKSLNYTLNEDTQLIEQDFIDFISDLRIKGWVPFMFSDDILDDEFKKLNERWNYTILEFECLQNDLNNKNENFKEYLCLTEDEYKNILTQVQHFKEYL